MTDYSVDIDFLCWRYAMYGTITECDGDTQTTRSIAAGEMDAPKYDPTWPFPGH